MAVPFIDDLFAVERSRFRSGSEFARIKAEAHGAALVGDVFLVGHEVDDGVRAVRRDLAGIGVCHAAHVAGKFDDRALHAETQAEERHFVFPRPADGGDLAFDAAGAEAAGDDDAAYADEDFIEGVQMVFQFFRIDPVDIDFRAEGKSRVGQGFRHGEVRVVEFDVLAHEGDVHLLFRGEDAVHHGGPFFHIAGSVFEAELLESDAVESFLLEEERHFIDAAAGHIGDDRFRIDVAEEGDLPLHIVGNFLFRAAHDDIRLDADAAQFLDAVLGGLRLELARRGDVGNEGDVDIEHVVPVRHVFFHLTDRFEEGLGFDIAHGAADLGDDDVRVVFAAHTEHTVFDLIGDVRDDLDGGAQIFPFPFLIDDGLVDFPGGHIGRFGQIHVDEAFVVAQVEVGLRAVVGDEDFAVLVRAHGAGVDIDIGIEFLDGDFIAAVFQQTAERGRGDAFAQRRYDAAGDENVFAHDSSFTCAPVRIRPKLSMRGQVHTEQPG